MIRFTGINGPMVLSAHARTVDRLACSIRRPGISQASSTISSRKCESIMTLAQRLGRPWANSTMLPPIAPGSVRNTGTDANLGGTTFARRIDGVAEIHDETSEVKLLDLEKHNEQDPEEHTGEQGRVPRETRKPVSRDRGRRLGSSVSKKAIEMELRWVRDRVALARRISELLTKDELEKAAGLLLAAEKEHIDCIVGWNLVFQYLMVKGKPFDAFKLYNDAKKRGLIPNSRTYTIMFHGFAQSPSARAVDAALSIYRSLRSPKSKVKPSVIHHNAILSVCARHGKMDRVWEMASDLPETGQANGPDAATFTVILQALRFTCEEEVSKMNSWSQADGILEKRQKIITEAKKIWADVVSQWKKGHLMIDGPLVLAMGKILASTGQVNDYYDMIALYNQTMRIPLLKSLKSQKINVESQDLPQQEDPDSMQPVSASDVGSTRRIPKKKTESLFDPPDMEDIRLQAEQNYDESIPKLSTLTPQNEDLALIIEACKQLPNHLGISIGKDYWELLTAKNGKWRITPDAISSHQYLRLLREARSSQETLRIMEEEMAPKGDLFPKTFIIALSTCFRDKNNPNIFTIASQLIDLMYSKLLAPDPRVIIRYIELVSSIAKSPAQLKTMVTRAHASGSKNPKPKDEKRAYQFVHTEALRHIRPHTRRIFQVLQYGTVRCPDLREPPPRPQPDAAVDLDFPGMLRISKSRRHQKQYGAVKIELDLAQSLSALSHTSKLMQVVLDKKLCVLKETSRPWFSKEAERLYRTVISWQKEKLADKTVVSLWVDGDTSTGVKELEPKTKKGDES